MFWRVSTGHIKMSRQICRWAAFAQSPLGSFASQEFYVYLRNFVQTLCGESGIFAETAVFPGKMINMYCGVLRRFAETTNPRKNWADKYQNPGSWNSLVSFFFLGVRLRTLGLWGFNLKKCLHLQVLLGFRWILDTCRTCIDVPSSFSHRPFSISTVSLNISWYHMINIMWITSSYHFDTLASHSSFEFHFKNQHVINGDVCRQIHLIQTWRIHIASWTFSVSGIFVKHHEHQTSNKLESELLMFVSHIFI